jgi:hypothetical protein
MYPGYIYRDTNLTGRASARAEPARSADPAAPETTASRIPLRTNPLRPYRAFAFISRSFLTQSKRVDR